MLASIAERVGRLYPFFSGAGSFANSALFRALDPPGEGPVIARVPGGRAVVPRADYVARAMRFVGDLDPKVSWVLDRTLHPGDTALDIGANLGLVSLRMCKLVGMSGTVHAFEPQPRMVRYLERTIELNPDLRLKLHPIALGAEAGTFQMTVPDHNAGGGSLEPTSPRPGDQMIEVEVCVLSDYAARIGLLAADVIKMDVEGFEARVLEGGEAFLQRTRPHTIILEENAPDANSNSSAALDLLMSLNYEIYALPKRLLSVQLRPLSERVPSHDYVALHREAPSRVREALRL